jgi:hypothetical protein
MNNRRMNDHQYLNWTHKTYGTNLTPKQRRRLSKNWVRFFVAQ